MIEKSKADPEPDSAVFRQSRQNVGNFEPNASLPCWSGAIGEVVALHRFGDGDSWVVVQRADGHWVTYRKATREDEDSFVAAGAALRI